MLNNAKKEIKMETKKKISTTIYITEKQNAELKALSKKTRVPISVYIRDGIDLILKNSKTMMSTMTR